MSIPGCVIVPNDWKQVAKKVTEERGGKGMKAAEFSDIDAKATAYRPLVEDTKVQE